MSNYWLWLMKQGVDGLLLFYPVTIVLAIGAIIGIAKLLSGTRPTWVAYGTVLLSAATPFVILFIGVAFKAPPSTSDPDGFGAQLLNGVVVGALVMVLAGVAFSGAKRVPVALIAAAFGWLAFWFWFVSAMSVSGVWL